MGWGPVGDHLETTEHAAASERQASAHNNQTGSVAVWAAATWYFSGAHHAERCRPAGQTERKGRGGLEEGWWRERKVGG